MKTSFKLIIVTLFSLSTAFGQLIFEPESIDFGPITVNTEITLEVNLSNQVDADNTVSFSGVSDPFSLSDEALEYSFAGEVQTLSITFAPTVAGLYSGTIYAESSVFGTTELIINAEGTLVEIITDTELLEFGEVSIGQTNSLDVTLSNNGTGTMLVSDMSIDDEQFTADFIEFTLQNSESQAVTITYSPTLAGLSTATLFISTNDPNTPIAEITLEGIGKTDMAGNISGTWSPINNPYHITADVTVPDGETLVIEPGVEIIFDYGYNFIVNGSLMAIGTPIDSIRINGVPEYNFGRIVIENSDSTFFSYCSFNNLASDLLFFDDLENGTGNWTFSGNGSMTWDTGSYHSGTHSVRTFYDGGNTTYNSYLTTPTFTVSQGLSAGYWYRIDWQNTNDYDFYFQISVNGGSWQTVWSDGNEQTSWTEKNHSLTSFANIGDEVQFRFWNKFYNYGYMWIDDFIINGTFGKKETIEISSSTVEFNNCDFSNLEATEIISVSDATLIINSSLLNNNSVLNVIASTGPNNILSINDSDIKNNDGSGIYLEDNYSIVDLNNVRLIENEDYGIYTSGTASGVDVSYSNISNNGNDGIYTASNSNIDVSYSLIAENGADGIQTSSEVNVNYSTIVNNTEHGIVKNASTWSSVNNSIIWGNQGDNFVQIENNGVFSASYSNIQGLNSYGDTGGSFDYTECIALDPLFADNEYHLFTSSPSVDAAAPWEHDNYMPPGLGTVRADMGLYGGPGNDFWGGEAVPDGVPSIDSITDLPQDQGGWVGIQYDGSIFDHSHSGYDITHYSFWRLMDLENRSEVDASHTPDSDYLNMGRDEYWEYVGEMTSQGFESYGYSAPTLGNTMDSVMFVSTFLVIAHTPAEDVFFTSEPASGYSVDNLAPPAPGNLYSTMQGSDLLLSWDHSTAEDFLYFTIFRNGEILSIQEHSEYLDDSMPYGSEVNYQITATDENNNTSELSELYSTYVNVVGDVNADYVLNIIDLILIVDCILDGAECGFDTVQMTIADIDDNGVIDILDLVQLIGIVLNNNSRVISDVTETNVYKYSDRLTHNGSGIIGYEITISHEPGIQINLTKDAFIANMVTDNNKSRIIILNPESELLFTSDGDFEIVEITSASTSDYVQVNMVVVPEEFELSPAYPNPFNPQTTIKYGLPEASQVTVSIYDMNGRLVEIVVDGYLDAGYHSNNWNASEVSSGMYFIQVQTAFGTNNQKIMLMK